MRKGHGWFAHYMVGDVRALDRYALWRMQLCKGKRAVCCTHSHDAIAWLLAITVGMIVYGVGLMLAVAAK